MLQQAVRRLFWKGNPHVAYRRSNHEEPICCCSSEVYIVLHAGQTVNYGVAPDLIALLQQENKGLGAPEKNMVLVLQKRPSEQLCTAWMPARTGKKPPGSQQCKLETGKYYWDR